MFSFEAGQANRSILYAREKRHPSWKHPLSDEMLGTERYVPHYHPLSGAWPTTSPPRLLKNCSLNTDRVTE